MTADVAREYAQYDKFHFVYTADFRGRIYCATTGLSPQGEDLSKSLLHFAVGKPVTESGLFWLAVHGANTFGNDKISYDDRVNWIYEHEAQLQRTYDDPVGNREWWGSADKPWQFLAFVFAWGDTAFGKDSTTTVSIPIGLDGSCNGLQHYSALLRDSVGGKGVNLINSEIPNDIYGDVGVSLEHGLMDIRHTDPMADIWLKVGITRKLTKRPVMTLPYGSTQQSAKEYVLEWMLDNRSKFPGTDDRELYKLAAWLTPHLWAAIGNVVIAARVGMSWLQKRTGVIINNTGKALRWVSPVGFPVYQNYMIQDDLSVQTTLLGGTVVRTNGKEPTDVVSKTKQRSGIAPNFVHSLDSSHMVMTINATNFQEYAMIHDDFGTQAADTETMWLAIRNTFVDMYNNKDPLMAWNLQHGAYDGDYPDQGDLDIVDVLDSQYFFG